MKGQAVSDQVLAVHDVFKVFDEGSHKVEVLKGVTMEVARGEVVALEGPSGSGKTTLLSIMGCILTPTSGRVDVAGTPVGATRPDHLRAVRRQSIGFRFPLLKLFPALTAPRKRAEGGGPGGGVPGRSAGGVGAMGQGGLK